jgi:hypothetical protein
MTKLEKFQLLNPRVTKIKIHSENDRVLGWELFADGERIGYGFNMKVPDQVLDVPDTEEFDIYEVTGILDTDFKIDCLDIVVHEDFNGILWAEDIVKDAYKNQYLGLTAAQLLLPPNGAVDAITGSTISSNTVTNAIRKKLERLESAFK